MNTLAFGDSKILLVFFVTCLLVPGHRSYILYLEEGEICQKNDGRSPDQYCRRPDNCPTLEQDIRSQKYPQICAFIGKIPVVCCSSEVRNEENRISNSDIKKPLVNSYSAAEMCKQYSEQLAYKTVRNPLGTKSAENQYIKVLDCYNAKPLIYKGEQAKLKEFPHMALIGYGSKTDEQKTWGCGGSLISDRWILSAAHCAYSNEKPASWARLGDVSKYSNTDDTNSKFYDIDRIVEHPNYDRSYVYNDIALFHLKTEVSFTAYIRPICLNANPSLNFKTASATGWGRISVGGPTSPDLLKIEVKPISSQQCKHSYPPTWHPRINLGILEDSMICAGDFVEGSDTCPGDSGGPLQIPHVNNTCMYTQIGITSFGKYCGSIDTPGIYTRVSNYISWIEPIVWPKKSTLRDVRIYHGSHIMFLMEILHMEDNSKPFSIHTEQKQNVLKSEDAR